MGIVSNIIDRIVDVVTPDKTPTVNVITKPPSSPQPRPPSVVPDSSSPTGYSDRMGNPVSPSPEVVNNNSGSGGSSGGGGYSGGGSSRPKPTPDNPLNLPVPVSNPITEIITRPTPNPISNPNSSLPQSRIGDIVPPTIPSNPTQSQIDTYNREVENYNNKIQDAKTKYYNEIYNNPEYSGGYSLANTYNPTYITPYRQKADIIQSGSLITPKKNVLSTGQGEAVASMPTSSERTQSKIKQYTGITLPTGTQAYNFLFTGADYGTPEVYQKVTPYRVLTEVPQATFITAPYLAGQFIGGTTASNLGASGKTSETIGKVTGTGAVIGGLFFGGTVADVAFGIAGVTSGTKMILSKEYTPSQKALGVAEVTFGSYFLGRGLGTTGIAATESKFFRQKLVPTTQRIESRAINLFQDTRSLLFPVQATEYGYIGGRRIVVPAISRTLGSIAGKTRTIKSKLIESLRPAQTEIVIGRTEFEAVKSRVAPISRFIKGTVSNVAETIKLAPQARMVRIPIAFIKETPRTIGSLSKALTEPVGVLKRSISPTAKELFRTEGNYVFGQSLKKPIQEIGFIFGDIKYGIKRRTTSIFEEARTFGTNIAEPVGAVSRGIFKTITPEKRLSVIVSPSETLAQRLDKLIPISKTPYEKVIQGYNIAKLNIKNIISSPFKSYKEAVVSASQRERLRDYLIRGGRMDLFVRPIEQKTLIITKQTMPSTSSQVLQVIQKPQIVKEVQTPVQSEFAGKGSYELTSLYGAGTMLISQTPTMSLQIQPTETNIKQGQTFAVPLSFAESKQEITSNIGRTKQLESQIFNVADIQNEIVITDIATSQRDLQAERQRDLQRFEQLQRQNEMFKQRERSKTRFIGFGFPKVYAKKKSILSKVKQAFKVVTYKGGKEITIASGLTEGAAKKAGVAAVLSSLRASFKLKPIGTTTAEDIEYTIPKGFRMSKVDKGRYVQEKTTRFGARSETKEAQFFRKQKAGKVKWF